MQVQSPPVLLAACSPSLGVDPILFLPMLNSNRNRLRRWRMGWLPDRPLLCSCDHVSACSHLIIYLHAATRLGVSPGSHPNPIDYVINQLPQKIPRSFTSSFVERWTSWWPALLSILLDIDKICHSDGGFSDDASDVSGHSLLKILTSPTPKN